MKRLTGRQEIAEALNFGKYPVLKIDLKDADEYGLKGSICRVDQGEFNDGSKWYERAELRVYSDEKKITFSAHGYALTAETSYMDFVEDLETAMSPIVTANSEIVVVVLDSEKREVYAVYVIETKFTSRHSTQPITVEPVDMTTWLIMAGTRYRLDYLDQMNRVGGERE